MLDQFRGPHSDVDASYTVAWAHLRKRYPRLRTVLVTAASGRDDATVAAVGLAEAAVRLDGIPVHVMVLDSAKRDRQALDSPVSSTTIIEALSPDQLRTALSNPSGGFALMIVVAPAPQTSPDCISLANEADVAILVARLGRTRFGDAQLAARLLRQVGVATPAALLLTKDALRSRTSAQAGPTHPSGHSQRIDFADATVFVHADAPAPKRPAMPKQRSVRGPRRRAGADHLN
jgi:hypothetical protein